MIKRYRCARDNQYYNDKNVSTTCMEAIRKN